MRRLRAFGFKFKFLNDIIIFFFFFFLGGGGGGGGGVQKYEFILGYEDFVDIFFFF